MRKAKKARPRKRFSGYIRYGQARCALICSMHDRLRRLAGAPWFSPLNAMETRSIMQRQFVRRLS